MPRFRKNRKQRRRAENLKAYSAIGLVLAIFIGLFIWFGFELASRQSLDQATGCALKGITSHTVVLVDQTDPFDKSQLIALREMVSQTVAQMAVGEKLSLFKLNDHDPFLEGPFFSHCLPETGSESLGITDNPAMLRKRFSEAFLGPLEDEIEQLGIQNMNSSRQTRIVESLLELSSRRDFDQSVPQRTLIVVSDMLQHSNFFSMYRNDLRALTDTKWKNLMQLSPTLPGVDVRILLIIRDIAEGGRYQGNQLMEFWDEYFERLGARLMSVKKAG